MQVCYRLDAHIFTDKVIYRPLDIVFIEVLFLDAFNKTPIAMNPLDLYTFNYYVNFELLDSNGQKLHSDYAQISNSTVTFTYKVPMDLPGGEYLISMYNQYMAPVKKLIRMHG